jgi:hypothetical protein
MQDTIQVLRTRTKVELCLAALFFASWVLYRVELAPVWTLVQSGWIFEVSWSTNLLSIIGSIALPVAVVDVVRDWRAYSAHSNHTLKHSH